MSNYLVTDSDLTSVANAIRTKGGTSAQLAFPSGFVSAIGDISGGGGGNVNISQDANGYLVIDDDAPSGGGGITTETLTYTSESDSSPLIVTLSKDEIPIRIDIKTDTTGTAVTDFTAGEIIGLHLSPVANSSLCDANKYNGIVAFRNLANSNLSGSTFYQSGTSAGANGAYSLISKELRIYRVSTNGQFLSGHTYTVTVYYAGGGS